MGRRLRHPLQPFVFGLSGLRAGPAPTEIGFQTACWADNARAGGGNEYQRFLKSSGIDWPRASDAHGMPSNGFPVRSFHLEERFHFTNWCADRAIVPTMGGGMQYLTDGRRKYIWWPGRGVEQYFNLEEDPDELVDLASDPRCAEEIAAWRDRLVAELRGRPERFTDGMKLISPET